MDVVGYVKGHPWTIGALVIGGVVTFILIRRASSSGAQVVVAGSSGPSDAQLADSTNLALAQISAGVQTNQTNAELTAAQLQAGLQGTVASLEAALGAKQVQAGEDVSLATLQAQLAGVVNTNQTQVTLEQQQTDLGAQTIAAQLAALFNTNSTAVQINTDNNQTTLGLNTIAAGVQNNQIAANTNIVDSLVAALTPKTVTPDPIPTVTQVVTQPPPTNIWDQYLTDNPDVAAWAASGHGDPNQPIADQSLEQRAEYQYFNTGQAEGRTLEDSTVSFEDAA